MKTVVVILVAVAGLWILRLAVPTLPPTTEQTPKPRVLSPAEDLAAAKNILSSKTPLTSDQVYKAAKHLRSIAPTLPEYKEVPGLLQRLSVH
jgi:hypothetical protein